jgi:formate hydrogenlyase subunit 6/NADH:ubiquinone oxidoreductase subunit I
LSIPKPKLRELKEAVIAVGSTLFGKRFTTRFPAEPCVVPEKYRGKPEFDSETCIGCGACVNVCPTNALTQIDDTKSSPPTRKIVQQTDACIFCANCSDNCTTQDGIKLSNKWDLANLDRTTMKETHEFELQLCEKCGHVIGTKKHLVWLYEKLGPLAYTNPSLLLAKSKELAPTQSDNLPEESEPKKAEMGDFMKILCPKCKAELNISK